MGRILTLLAALLTAVALGGCGLESEFDESEGERPSAATLDELRESSRFNPIYWLGETFEGLEISGAELGEEGAWVSYGQRSCDTGSGCTAFPIQISSSPGWPRDYLPPAKRRYTCFERIRGGVLVEDCRNHRHAASQWGRLHVGPSGLDDREGFGNSNYVTLSIAGPIGGGYGLRVADLVRQIYPIDSGGKLSPFPPPDPVPCPRLEYLVRWWVVANVREMGPNPHCGVPELLGL